MARISFHPNENIWGEAITLPFVWMANPECLAKMVSGLVVLGRYIGLDQGARAEYNVLGVDLGTTNSTATWVKWTGDPGEDPEVVVLEITQPTESGSFLSALVPSVVFRRAGGETWVGQGARELVRKTGREGVVPEQTLFAETKNDIGTPLTYPRAPADLASPQAVAAHILGFLHREALGRLPEGRSFDRVVVTVPASFSLQQREQTRAAAAAAGLDLEPADLLDEPVAAFIDGLVSSPEVGDALEEGASRALLFDFGGGTCDVALLRLNSRGDGTVAAVTAGVSRYTRLGGADIDRAIADGVLLPALYEYNEVDPGSMDWSEKSRMLIPQLLAVAEELKLKLSREEGRRRAFGRPTEGLVAQSPADLRVVSRSHGQLLLPSDRVQLSYEALRRVLRPFLDPDHLTPVHGEYFDSCSVLAPVFSTLTRAGWDAEDVDLVLLAGGSSKLSLVQEAMAQEFGHVVAISDPDEPDSQTEISRGAAIHALSLAVTGAPIVEPRVAEDVELRARGDSDAVVLVRSGASLPAPNEFGGQSVPLVLPADLSRGLRIELRRGGMDFHAEVLDVPAGVKPGDPLDLWYRIDVDQLVTLEVGFPSAPSHSGNAKEQMKISAAWSYVHDEPSARVRALELEQRLKSQGGSATRNDRLALIAAYRELRFYDRAREQARKLISVSSNEFERAQLLNLLGVIEHERGDLERASASYRQAAEIGRTPWPMHNLASIQLGGGDVSGALASVQEALKISESPETRLLRAKVLKRMGNESECRSDLLRVVADVEDDEHADSDALAAARSAARQLEDAAAERRLARRMTQLVAEERSHRGELPVVRTAP